MTKIQEQLNAAARMLAYKSVEKKRQDGTLDQHMRNMTELARKKKKKNKKKVIHR